MRWKPLDERDPPQWLVFILVGITSPVWGPMLGLLWLCIKLDEILSPGKEWKSWFAWRPVRIWGDGAVATVWLERVERRRDWGGSTDYRLPALTYGMLQEEGK